MKELAAKRDMMVHQVIQKSGLNQATISELMSGRTKHPKVSTTRKFRDGLEISLNDFFNSSSFAKKE